MKLVRVEVKEAYIEMTIRLTGGEYSLYSATDLLYCLSPQSLSRLFNGLSKNLADMVATEFVKESG